MNHFEGAVFARLMNQWGTSEPLNDAELKYFNEGLVELIAFFKHTNNIDSMRYYLGVQEHVEDCILARK